MPAGQPTKYSPDLAQRMLDFCSQGYSLTAFAGEIGVCRDTISEWANVHPEFSLAVRTAKARRAAWWEKRAMNVADEGGKGSGQATMIIFGLKNHSPEDFKDKTEHEFTVSEELSEFLGGMRKERRISDDHVAIEADYEELPNGKRR